MMLSKLLSFETQPFNEITDNGVPCGSTVDKTELERICTEQYKPLVSTCNNGSIQKLWESQSDNDLFLKLRLGRFPISPSPIPIIQDNTLVRRMEQKIQAIDRFLRSQLDLQDHPLYYKIDFITVMNQNGGKDVYMLEVTPAFIGHVFHSHFTDTMRTTLDQCQSHFDVISGKDSVQYLVDTLANISDGKSVVIFTDPEKCIAIREYEILKEKLEQQGITCEITTDIEIHQGHVHSNSEDMGIILRGSAQNEDWIGGEENIELLTRAEEIVPVLNSLDLEFDRSMLTELPEGIALPSVRITLHDYADQIKQSADDLVLKSLTHGHSGSTVYIGRDEILPLLDRPECEYIVEPRVQQCTHFIPTDKHATTFISAPYVSQTVVFSSKVNGRVEVKILDHSYKCGGKKCSVVADQAAIGQFVREKNESNSI